MILRGVRAVVVSMRLVRRKLVPLSEGLPLLTARWGLLWGL